MSEVNQVWFTRTRRPAGRDRRAPPGAARSNHEPLGGRAASHWRQTVWGHPKESDRPDAVGLAASLSDTAMAVETVLEAELPRPAGAHAKLFEAMRYSVSEGGSGCGRSWSGPGRSSPARTTVARCWWPRPSRWSTATLSSTTTCRRWTTTICAEGKPSCHVAFDEATAILAGDALLTLAFELAARPKSASGAFGPLRARAGDGRAAAGGGGMVGGQMIDLAAEHGRGRPTI